MQLHVGELQLGETGAQRLAVLPEAVADRVEDPLDGIDGQSPVLEVRRVLVEVDGAQLEQPDDVVRHDHRRRRSGQLGGHGGRLGLELRPSLGGQVVAAGAGPGLVAPVLRGPTADRVLPARCPEGAHPCNVTGTTSREVGPKVTSTARAWPHPATPPAPPAARAPGSTPTATPVSPAASGQPTPSDAHAPRGHVRQE